MASLISVIASSPTRAVALFDADMDTATLTGGAAWASIEATGEMLCEVTDSYPLGARSFELSIGPAMSPGAVYDIIAADTIRDAAGGTLSLGQRTDTVTAPSEMLGDPVEDYTAMEAVTEAVADEGQQLAGAPTTKAVANGVAPFTAWFVESTLEFPDSGAFFCRGLRFSYTSRGEVSFRGVTQDAGQNPMPAGVSPVAEGDVIVLDPRSVLPTDSDVPLAATEQLLHSTLLHKARGDDFDSYCRFLGLPRIQNWPIERWRAAAMVVAFNSRGSMATTYRFLYEAMKDYVADYQVTVLGSTLAQFRITYVSGGPAAGFTQFDLFRLWLIDGVVYWSTTGDGVWSGGTSTYLVLSRFGSSYWDRCSWREAGYSPSVPTQLLAQKLPFFFDERDNLVDVRMDFGAAVLDTPPTYLQTAYPWEIPDLAWQPNMGYPWYEVKVAQEAGTLEGLQITADFGGTPARYGDYTVTLYINGVATALTCTLGDTDTEAVDNTHTVSYVAGDELEIVFSTPLVAPSPGGTDLANAIVSVRRQVPSGEPPGGYILADATADDPNTGPWPLYLGGSEGGLWQAFLSKILALGTAVKVKSGSFGAF